MKRIFALLTLLIFLFSWGCVPREENTDFRVLTSFYPIHLLTLNITKGVEGVSVTQMAAQQTGCLHDYQLSTADMKKLSVCDLFLINGGGMESFLDQAMKSLPDLKVIPLTEGLALSSDNPHGWLSPALAAGMAERIAHALCEADPGHADQYQANAAQFKSELSALGEELASALQGAENQKAVIFQASFAYLLQEAGCEVLACLESDHGNDLSAKEINAVVSEIKANPGCILLAADSHDTAARTVARETGLSLHTLDPLTSGSETPEAYAQGIRKNIARLKEAFHCE